MRVIFPLLLLLTLGLANYSTAQCTGDRFKSPVFDTFVLTTNVVYGSNYSYDFQKGEAGTSKVDLQMDIYTPPLSDTMSKRPTLLLMHGGSFVENSRKSAEILHMCETFAKHGYVTITMSYRLGIELPVDSVNALRMAYRAIQDGKAAVRYLRSVAADYGIDPDKIYAGGTSAGAILGMNIAYLNKGNEIPSYVDTSAHGTLNPKGLDGLLGKTNELYQYSSKIQGIINLCGATKHGSWLDDEEANIPILSMHGDEDEVVPYGNDIIYFQGIPLLKVLGSYSIDKLAKSKGIPSAFRTWCGAKHVPYYDLASNSMDPLYMDSVMSFLNKHMYEQFLGCPTTEGLNTNIPCWDRETNSVFNAKTSQLSVYPNPAQDFLIFGESTLPYSQVSAINLKGIQYPLEISESKVDISSLPAGMYLIRATQEGTISQSVFIKN